MGTCASRPSNRRRGPTPVEDDGVGLSTTVPISRRQMVTASVDNCKRSTADLISSAFLAQAEVEPESKGIAARLASRRGADDRRASAQAAHLGLGPAPAAESRADLADGVPAASIPKETPLPRSPGAPPAVCPIEDSFELSRAETVKRLAMLQKSFKGAGGAAGPSPVWAFTSGREPNDDDDVDGGAGRAGRAGGRCNDGTGRGGGGDDTSAFGNRRAAGGGGARRSYSSSGSCGGAWNGGAAEGNADREPRIVGREVDPGLVAKGQGEEAVEEEVVPLGEAVGDAPVVTTEAATEAAKAPKASARAGVGRDEEEMVALGEAAVAGREGSRRSEACATPRRDEDPGGGSFRTVSVARMQGGSAKAAAAAMPPPPASPVPPAAGDVPAAGAGILAAPTTDVVSETDELMSLPLPNLIRGGGGATRGGGAGGVGGRLPSRSGPGHRYSAAAYLQQAPMEPVVSLGGGVTRNSDLGYYLEETRYATAAAPPLQGAQPIRHNLMDSPMVRQRAAAAAAEAEAAARAPVVLDYVPILRSQGSRTSLLVQPSQKRLLPGGGGAGLPLYDDDGDGGAAAAARRLEYTPNRAMSRKFSHVNLHSSSTLLGVGSSSRPISPVQSRPSLLLAVADYVPISPRGTTGGGDSDERCFHVTRAGAATTAAAAAAAMAPSGNLPLALSAGGIPAAAASPLGGARRRDATGAGERREASSSASEVHFGPIAVLHAPATPPPPPFRPTPSQEHSRRAQRAIVPVLEPQRPSAPAAAPPLQASPMLPSRLHMHSGSIVNAGGGGRRSAVHEVLGSAAWTGPGSATAAPSPPLATALSASSIARGGVISSDLTRIDGREGASGGGAAGAGGTGGGSASVGGYGAGSASRTAGRAARLLESLQRLGAVAPEVSPVQ